jgi:hypothetical protein
MALGLILGLSTAQASSANPIATVTYTGQATNIFDPTGLFGAPSSDLFSAAFVNVFTVDLSKGQLNHYNFGGIAEDQLLGGSFYGALTPIVSSTLSINGHTVGFAGDRVGQEDNREGVFVNSAASSGALGGESGLATQIFTTIETDAPLSLFEEYTGTATPQFGYGGGFGICHLTATSANTSGCFPESNILQGMLTAQTVTIRIADAGSVPEPGTWALMLVGAACVGATLRLRKKMLTAAT